MGVTSQKCKFDASKNISHKNTINVSIVYILQMLRTDESNYRTSQPKPLLRCERRLMGYEIGGCGQCFRIFDINSDTANEMRCNRRQECQK
jgi:hypothetical protein